MEWPVVVLILGILVVTVGTFSEFYKMRIKAGQEDALRQLVSRYEQLAEKTMDAQQRVAADVSELRSRTASMNRS